MNNLIIEGFYNYDKYSMYVLRIDWCRLFLHNLAHFCKTISSKYRIRWNCKDELKLLRYDNPKL